VTVRCPRCTRPITNDTCAQCGPAATGLLAPSLAWPGETPWPRARRSLDDLAPPRERRPLIVATVLLILAVLLVGVAVA